LREIHSWQEFRWWCGNHERTINATKKEINMTGVSGSVAASIITSGAMLISSMYFGYTYGWNVWLILLAVSSWLFVVFNLTYIKKNEWYDKYYQAKIEYIKAKTEIVRRK